MIFRTQLFNPADMPNVVKIQAGYKVQPLSTYLKQPAPTAAPAINYMKANAEIAKAELLGGTRFFAAIFSAEPRRGGDPREAREYRHRARQAV